MLRKMAPEQELVAAWGAELEQCALASLICIVTQFESDIQDRSLC